MFSGGLFTLGLLALIFSIILSVIAYNIFSSRACYINLAIGFSICLLLFSLAFSFDSITHLYAWLKYDDVRCWTYTDLFHDNKSLQEALNSFNSNSREILYYVEDVSTDANGRRLYNFIRIISCKRKAEDVDTKYSDLVNK